jgi:hypothetical protein
MVNSSVDSLGKRLGDIMYLEQRLTVQNFLLIITVILSVMSFSWVAYGEGAFDDGVNRIYSVNHTTHTLIINDESYSMLIGLKVYTFDLKTRRKQLVNRYALKEEQAVTYVSEVRSGANYLSEVTILR